MHKIAVLAECTDVVSYIYLYYVFKYIDIYCNGLLKV